MRKLLHRTSLTVGLLAALAWPASAQFSVFVDPHTGHPEISGGTIGFAFAGDMFVGTVQRDGTDVLYSTDLTGGSVALFAPTVSLAGTNASEHFVASSLGLGGFPNRDIYVASDSGVVHITHNGLSSDNFVTGLNGSVRGILFDSIGTFGGDMFVTTAAGGVYRINAAGQFIDSAGIAHAAATTFASTGEDTEGLDIAPIGPGAHFGAFNGDLIVASEGSGKLRAIDSLGNITDVATVSSAEELSFVPLDLGVSGNPVEGMYGADYTPDVVKAPASAFMGDQGDIVITGETTHLVSRVHFNGSTFDVLPFGSFPNQPEDGIFVTTAIIRGGSVPEPGPAALLGGAAISGLLFLRRRRTQA